MTNEERARRWIEDRDLGRATVESDVMSLAIQFDKVREEAVAWADDEDEWSGKIRDAFPTRSGSHEEYGIAMRMVGNRHSKGELVSLVNWLLVELNKPPRPVGDGTRTSQVVTGTPYLVALFPVTCRCGADLHDLAACAAHECPATLRALADETTEPKGERR